MPQIPHLLNKTLSSDSIKLKFVVPPIAIPIDIEGRVVTREKATDIHYGTSVFEEQNSKLHFLEFDKLIFAGLMGYIHRHKSLDHLEIIFFRNDDGQMRMTIGSEKIMSSDALDKLRAQMKIINDKVEQFYGTNTGYKVHDITGEMNA